MLVRPPKVCGRRSAGSLSDVCVYRTSSPISQAVCEAFRDGCGGHLVKPYPLQPGTVVMYGCLRGLMPTLRQAQQESRTWFYMDNGYFKPGHFKGYYRVTRGAYQHDGSGEGNRKRWNALKLKIKPWRTSGGHIVLCPPATLYAALLWNEDAEAWIDAVTDELCQYTDRPIVVRRKMQWERIKQKGLIPLADDLCDAWALVTHSSNAAVEATLAGIPVFCTHPCASRIVSAGLLSSIESPHLSDDRERWAMALAANQWTLKEMRKGVAWSYLNNTG